MIGARRAVAALAAAALLAATLGGCSTSNGDGTSSGASGSASSGGSCPNDVLACPSTAPSYAKDVAPVIEASCTPCHAAGGQQSQRLLTDYADLHAQRSPVLDQVHACRMPPAGSPPLTAAGRAVILDWLECGAPDN